jgi:hypothetical protein
MWSTCSATEGLYSALNFCATVTQQLQNFRMFTRSLYIVSLHKQNSVLYPHQKTSNCIQSFHFRGHRNEPPKYEGIQDTVKNIFFRDREKKPFSNTVTQISICGKTKFSKSAYKVVLREGRVL